MEITSRLAFSSLSFAHIDLRAYPAVHRPRAEYANRGAGSLAYFQILRDHQRARSARSRSSPPSSSVLRFYRSISPSLSFFTRCYQDLYYRAAHYLPMVINIKLRRSSNWRFIEIIESRLYYWLYTVESNACHSCDLLSLLIRNKRLKKSPIKWKRSSTQNLERGEAGNVVSKIK